MGTSTNGSDVESYGRGLENLTLPRHACLGGLFAGVLHSTQPANSRGERMKGLTGAVLLTLLLVLSSCPNAAPTTTGNNLAPPSWIQGTWEYSKQNVIGWATGWSYPPGSLIDQWTFSANDVVSIKYATSGDQLIDWKTNGNETTDQSTATTSLCTPSRMAALRPQDLRLQGQ